MNDEYRNYLLSKKNKVEELVKPIIANAHERAKPHQVDCLNMLRYKIE